MLFAQQNIDETSGLMLAKFFAATVLLVCIAMALRMALPLAQQRWIDARLRRAQWLLMDRWQAMTNWRRRKALRKSTEAEAEMAMEAAIKKARSGSKMTKGEWDGNVYRPERFKPKDPRDLH